MPRTYDFSRLRLGNYDVVWNSVFMGATDKVNPDFTLKLKEKKVGSLGDIVIGHWILGLEGKVTCEFREVDKTAMQKVMPWYTSGNIPLVPATWHKDLYDYAQTLILHPSDLAEATVDQDLAFTKTVPIYRPMERDGETPDKIIIDFMLYPDRSQLTTGGAPVLTYGNYGNA